jgi:glutaminyl-peptide cyclotransferase
MIRAGLIAMALLTSLPGWQPPSAGTVPVQGYRIVRAYSHDPDAFTQGLEYVDGMFYEGTGLNGRSSVRKVRIESGEVLQKRDLPQEHFGEGIAVFNSELFELTWQSRVAFVYDKVSFEPKRRLSYAGEGWGLTHDGRSLIMSDGTDELRVLDPSTFAERRRIKVTAAGAPVRRLNELEIVRGEIFANIWMTDYMARIDPSSGRVTAYVDLHRLLSPTERARTDVLNGIAYDAEHDRLFVTGKLWPKLFEIKIE